MDKKRVMALVLSTVMALSGAACSTPASKETAAAGTFGFNCCINER